MLGDGVIFIYLRAFLLNCGPFLSASDVVCVWVIVRIMTFLSLS